ncbi:MAG: TPM domain-containing protein [Clostridia bacterium]|nr:TPM domain-containing protein [Clostridia bacterium]
MKKRVWAVLTAAILVIVFCLPALAAALPLSAGDDVLLIASGEHPARLVDNADLLTDSMEQLLLAKLDEVSERQNFDVVVVTASTIDGKSPMAYADDFFDYNGYGKGVDRSGALLLISMEDRDWWISTRGYGITALTDFGIQKIGEDMIRDGLSDGDYYEAFVTFVKDCDSYVTQAKNGTPVDKGTYKEPFPFVKRIGVSAIIGLIVSLVVGSTLKGKMKTVRAAKAAAEYTRPGSFYLRDQSDVFLYNQVTRTAKPQETRSGGGGSSTHTSSSGASHGGGGGKF